MMIRRSGVRQAQAGSWRPYARVFKWCRPGWGGTIVPADTASDGP
jgi:hypothetical protein